MTLLRTVGRIVAIPLVAGAVAALAQISGAVPADSTAKVVDAAGHLRVSAKHRILYQALRRCAIRRQRLASKGNPRRLRLRRAIYAYWKTGHCPNGAVLVKEVFATPTNEVTTGTASYTDKLKGWFVMVRGSEGTQPGSPLWGDLEMVVVRRGQAAQNHLDGLPRAHGGRRVLLGL